MVKNDSFSAKEKKMFVLKIIIFVSILTRCCFADLMKAKSLDADFLVAQRSMTGYNEANTDEKSLAQNSAKINIRQVYENSNVPNFDARYRPFENKRCPLCDSSVYPYCGEKLLHDACCCTDSYYHQLPYQCKLANCRFLHAYSCQEHRLIANCCCNDEYRSLLRSIVNN